MLCCCCNCLNVDHFWSKYLVWLCLLAVWLNHLRRVRWHCCLRIGTVDAVKPSIYIHQLISRQVASLQLAALSSFFVSSASFLLSFHSSFFSVSRFLKIKSRDILSRAIILKLLKFMQLNWKFSFNLNKSYHSIALETLYNFAFDCVKIWQSGRPQIHENVGSQRHLWASRRLCAPFAAKRFVQSKWTQKII